MEFFKILLHKNHYIKWPAYKIILIFVFFNFKQVWRPYFKADTKKLLLGSKDQLIKENICKLKQTYGQLTAFDRL